MKQQYALFISWVIALVAMLGSLYFSEIRQFVPCTMCWYQRIFMYPLVLILGIGSFQNDFNVKKIALPLSIIGLLISTWHYLEQKVPGFAEIKPCTQGVPCSSEYINVFGFITIPFLAGTAFLLISLILIFTKKDKAI
ncbi:disulfide oxidoreductase [Mammaliicoccus sciuri]|uniref:disulfide oxidoreductase n=2 Tax=Mammaliicoccus sciuri TaxID=1296 RepID=UPI0017836C42|nr:disulfide oxidoreductase [Mammaliicoccus sciuri]MBO3081040.1 disulfide bond formation protein B [Mammaliicoccus sciuri]MDT0695046.1 disulfide oxidoreductase [Mammaliicoccus sciuri]QPW12523.1 disulfide bond formation protein B [Mammaliicoccus sciuri]QYG31970.1 disulfide bond formation protein B [Mammaliicoccus sciuri]